MTRNGGGSDTQANCILEVCCGGANSKQVKVLAEVAQRALAFLSPVEAVEVAEWIARNWDLMPKGTTYDLKQAIAKLARGPGYDE